MNIAPDHPAPEVPARPAEADEIPRTAKSLIKLAAAADLEALTFYARGTDPGSPTRDRDGNAIPMRVVDSVGLVVHRPGEAWRIVAWWLDGSFLSAYRIDDGVIERLTTPALRAHLRDAGRTEDAA